MNSLLFDDAEFMSPCADKISVITSTKWEITMRSKLLDPEETWQEIIILLTRELENSKVRVVGTHEMRTPDKI